MLDTKILWTIVFALSIDRILQKIADAILLFITN